MGRKTDMFLEKVLFKGDNLPFLIHLRDNKYLDNALIRQRGLKAYDTSTMELMGLLEYKEGPDPSFVITKKGLTVITLWESFVVSLTRLMED